MHVVATAGHIDHGKTALVDALTGMRSDRLTEEIRRGVSIELGYVWTNLGGAGRVAFVDVPGHERYIGTTLAGFAPVRAALLVVAADDPWMPQTAEHLAALAAFGVAHCVAAITRCDLADPGPMRLQTAARLVGTPMADAPIVNISVREGRGLDDLRSALEMVLRRMPIPSPAADVRLWTDRTFTAHGHGVIATGTLEAGTISRGDSLQWRHGLVRVRSLQCLGMKTDRVTGPARVALNLAGKTAGQLAPGDVLMTPDGAWQPTAVFDARLDRDEWPCPRSPLLHLGTHAIQVRARQLDAGHIRLYVDQPLPVRPGDRALLRDPGDRTFSGIQVLDPWPVPHSKRRGWALARAQELAGIRAELDLEMELRRRGWMTREQVRAMGFQPTDDPPGAVATAEHLIGADLASRAPVEIERAVEEARGAPTTTAAVVAQLVGLPSGEAVIALMPSHLSVRTGVICSTGARRLDDLRDRLYDGQLEDSLQVIDQAYATLRGIESSDLRMLAMLGELVEIEAGTFLPSTSVDRAFDIVRRLPEPWTVGQARVALEISRRNTLLLLHHMESADLVRKDADDRRRCRRTNQ